MTDEITYKEIETEWPELYDDVKLEDLENEELLEYAKAVEAASIKVQTQFAELIDTNQELLLLHNGLFTKDLGYTISLILFLVGNLTYFWNTYNSVPMTPLTTIFCAIFVSLSGLVAYSTTRATSEIMTRVVNKHIADNVLFQLSRIKSSEKV